MNIYLLTSGLVLLGLCLLHIFFGEKNYFTTKEKRYIAGYVPYHQISVVMLLQGFGLIYSALYFNLVLPEFILFLTIGNLLAFIIICVKEKKQKLSRHQHPNSFFLQLF